MTVERLTLPGYNVGVMVEHKNINIHLTKMCDVIRNTALNTFVQKDENDEVMDEDSVMALLHESINDYIEYIFSQPSKVNRPFVDYLDEHFARVAPYLRNDPTRLSYLESEFAQACSTLASCLMPAVDDLADKGYAIDTVKDYSVDGMHSYYVIMGEDFGIEEQTDENT